MTSAAEKPAASGLRRALGVVDYFALAFGSIVGVGWVVLMHDWLHRGGPAGAVLGFVLGGLLLVPVGVAYGRLTARLPQADSEMGFTAGLLPLAARFGVGWMMTLAYVVVCPFEAVAVSQLAAQLWPPLEQVPLYRVGDSTVYLPGLALGLALVLFVTAMNAWGVRHGALIQNLFTFGLLAAFVVFAGLGLLRGSVGNLRPAFPTAGAGGAVLSTFLVLQIVPYYMAGFETVSRCAEERRADFADHRFVGITLAAVAVGVFFYASVILVVALLWPWQELPGTASGDLAGKSPATLVAFRQAFGSEFLVNLILFGAILSLIKVFNGCFLAASRQLFAMGRSGMIPRQMADLHPRWHTPRWAILLIGTLAAAGCFLGKAALVPIAEVGSFAYVVGWLAACLAYCWGVAGRSRLERWLIGPAGVAVGVLLLGMKLVPYIPGCFTLWEYVALGGWLGLGAILWFLRPGKDESVPRLSGD
jgi:amino acid transporter